MTQLRIIFLRGKMRQTVPGIGDTVREDVQCMAAGGEADKMGQV